MDELDKILIKRGLIFYFQGDRAKSNPSKEMEEEIQKVTKLVKGEILQWAKEKTEEVARKIINSVPTDFTYKARTPTKKALNLYYAYVMETLLKELTIITGKDFSYTLSIGKE